MKTSLLIGIVIAAHAVLVTVFVFTQGCVSTTPVIPPPQPKLPPSAAPVGPPVVTPVATRPAAPPMPAETTTYVVKSGDSLSVIASRFDLNVKDIMTLNGLKNENLVRIGQKLILPGKVNLGAPEPARSPARTAPPGGALHEVKAGDTLSELAREYGTTTAALREANQLSSDVIKVGQKLIVPAAKPGAAPSAPAPAAAAPVRAPAPAAPAPAPEEAPVAAPPAPPASSAAPAAAPGALRTKPHTVAAGEDLHTIAMMYDVSSTELQQLNNLSGAEMKVGQVIKIPMHD